MKNSFSFFTTLTLLSLTLFSCKDKIDLIGAGKESAVVIGILDASESTHYIKITRTFIGDGVTSSVDIAQIPDSSYFNNISVKIEEIGGAGRSWNLHDTIIQNKENGAFYSPEQKVYVFYTNSSPLNPNASYKLTATIDNGRIVVTGQTGLVSGITPGNWTGITSSIKLTTSGPTLGEYINHSFNMTSVGNSYRMNAKIRFDYREFSTGLTDSTDHSILFNMGESDVTPGAGGQSFSLSGETFYKTLREKIPVSASVEKRVHLGFEVIVTGASRELVNYIDVNKPSSSLAQTKPKFTNLEITEGHSVIGIFASRQTITNYRPAATNMAQQQALDDKSRRELCIGPTTGPLGFCSRHARDKYVPGSGNQSINNWYCGN